MKKQKRAGHFLFFIKLPMNYQRRTSPACVQQLNKPSFNIETYPQMTPNEHNKITEIENFIFTNKITNEFLVSMLKLATDYLSLERVSDTAKRTGKTTQGIRKHREIIKICDYQLTINNN